MLGTCPLFLDKNGPFENIAVKQLEKNVMKKRLALAVLKLQFFITFFTSCFTAMFSRGSFLPKKKSKFSSYPKSTEDSADIDGPEIYILNQWKLAPMLDSNFSLLFRYVLIKLP